MLDTGSFGIESTPTGITIHVYVAPRSSANKVVGVHNGALKVALTAPPVEGAANKALVEFFAKTLDVPKSAVKLVSGETSRHKVISVVGVEAQASLKRLMDVSQLSTNNSKE
jgi:uncharacterized protein (TIGR00251 family)